MRLEKKQVNLIIYAVTPLLENQPAELRLYGSRTDPTKKGGDIDLVLIFDKPFKKDQLILFKATLLNEIKKQIGEQKIDLRITDRDAFLVDPFWQIISPESIVLHRWEKK